MTGVPILVVDDRAANLKLAQKLLEREGYEVRTANDAGAALDLLRSWKPRLILLDVRLPGMSGLDLTRRLKAEVATRDIIVVALTAEALPGDEERARAAGCDGYVTKPIDIESLPLVIAGLLAARKVIP